MKMGLDYDKNIISTEETKTPLIGEILMKMKMIVIIVSALSLVLGGTIGIRYFSDLSTYRKEIAAIKLAAIDLNTIPDGTYGGSFDTVWIGAYAEVRVEDHRIIDIDLTHRHNRGRDAEVIPDRVIEAQSLNVDMVSGATNSCIVILKAIESALLTAE